MAGFAAIINEEPINPKVEADFHTLANTTAQLKQLDMPGKYAVGPYCIAAKFDSSSSLHTGIVTEPQSGSWIMACGTVVALYGENEAHAVLLNLLRAYLDHGVGALNDIDGHFAVAIFDNVQKRLSVISDPIGYFSIFYGKRGTETLFSTSSFAIARLTQAKPDILAMDSFLRSGMLHGEQTVWEGVKRVLPATIHKFSANTHISTEYWKPTYDESVHKLPLNKAMECADGLIRDLMTRAVAREGKVLADLTGGFDSRVTSMYLEKIGVPFTAYSVGPACHPDVQIPQKICQTMGWEYLHMPLPTGWEELQFEWLSTALYKGDARLGVAYLATTLYGHQQRSRISRVNVTGLGVDEWRETTYPRAHWFNWGKIYQYDKLLNGGILFPLPADVMQENREIAVREAWKAELSHQASLYASMPYYVKGHAMFIHYRYPAHGGSFLSAGSGIIRSISPFCFKAPINFSFSLPNQWRIFYHHWFLRNFLEAQSPNLANIETSKGGPATPMRVTNIQRFWPMWRGLVDQRLKGFSRNVFRKFSAPQSYCSDPQTPLWRTTLVRRANADGLFDAHKMVTGGLYQRGELLSLAKQVEEGQSWPWTFLERVMTLEFAIRDTASKTMSKFDKAGV